MGGVGDVEEAGGGDGVGEKRDPGGEIRGAEEDMGEAQRTVEAEMKKTETIDRADYRRGRLQMFEATGILITRRVVEAELDPFDVVPQNRLSESVAVGSGRDGAKKIAGGINRAGEAIDANLNTFDVGGWSDGGAAGILESPVDFLYRIGCVQHHSRDENGLLGCSVWVEQIEAVGGVGI